MVRHWISRLTTTGSLNLAESFDLGKHPRVETGQLSEDIADIRELLGREGGEVWLWHDLAHVAGILLRIASLDLPQATG